MASCVVALDGPMLSVEDERRLIAVAQDLTDSRRDDAAHMLVKRHEPLILKWVSENTWKMQVGRDDYARLDARSFITLSILRAIKIFDASRGNRLSTLALYDAAQELRKASERDEISRHTDYGLNTGSDGLLTSIDAPLHRFTGKPCVALPVPIAHDTIYAGWSSEVLVRAPVAHARKARTTIPPKPVYRMPWDLWPVAAQRYILDHAPARDRDIVLGLWRDGLSLKEIGQGLDPAISAARVCQLVPSIRDDLEIRFGGLILTPVAVPSSYSTLDDDHLERLRYLDRLDWYTDPEPTREPGCGLWKGWPLNDLTTAGISFVEGRRSARSLVSPMG